MDGIDLDAIMENPMIGSIFQVIANYGGEGAAADVASKIAEIFQGEVFQGILAGLFGIIGGFVS